MEFRLLGPFQVVDGGEQVELGGRKQRAVLAALAIRANRVVPLDCLIAELWGDKPPPRATGTLQAYVSNLRRCLEAPRSPGDRPRMLVTHSPGYMLVLDPTCIDVARFEVGAAEGRRLLDEGEPAAARARLDEALALWRGPALADFAFEEFARLEVARLEELRLAALEDRLHADLDLGGHAGAVAELERLVAAHPLRERLWGLLMLALYRSGRQADALRAYQAARSALRAELGVEPGAALRRIEADILAQAPALDWRPLPSEPSPAAVVAARGSAPSTDDGAPLLVGRQTELALLEAILAGGNAEPGSAVLIHGEPGIGKTRLAQEFVQRAQAQGFGTGWGSSVEGGGTPAYWPWVEVVRSLIGAVGPEAAGAAASPFAAELGQLVPEVRELTGTDPSPLAFDPETARLRLFEAVTGFLAALGQSRTVIVVLDDLHWADAASLQLLSFLAARLRQCPVLVVGTYRPAEVGPDHPLRNALAALARRHTAERIGLEGLDEAAVGALLEVTLGTPPAPDVVATVRARTEGNPFFITELARMMAAGAGGIETADRTVPAAVHDVLRHRVGRLPEPTVALLNLAAVVGRTFDLAVLQLATNLTAERTLELVEAALMTGLVVEHPEIVGRFRFSHDLVRETLLDGLTALRRVRLHARIADALEALHGADERHAIELAHHFFAAVPYVGAARALPHLIRAAEIASGRLAHEQAEDHLRRALDLIGKFPEGEDRQHQQLDVLLRLSSVLTVTKGYADPEIGGLLDDARRLSARLGESEQVVRALFGLMLFHLVAARYGTAQDVACQLLDIAADSGRPADQVAAHLAVGIVAVQQGDLGTAAQHLEAAHALPDALHDPSLVAWFPMHPVICASCFLAWAVWELGDRCRASQLVEEALGFANGLGHDLTTAHALDAATRIAVMDGDAERARARSERALLLRGKRSSPLYDAIHAVHHGWARAHAGEPSQGIAELQAGLAAMETTGAWMLHTLFLALLAEAQRAAGKRQEALASVERGLEFAERFGERFWEPELHRLRGELLIELAPDHVSAGVAEFEMALGIARGLGAAALEDRAADSLRRHRAIRPTGAQA